MSTRNVYFVPTLELPWSSSTTQDKIFGFIAAGFLVGLLVIIFGIAMVELPEPTREELEQVPPALAKVVLEKKEIPKEKPPEPPKVEKKEKPKPKEPEKKPEPKPEPKPKPVEKPVAAKVEDARKKAAVSGLLQFQDDLMEMRENLEPSRVGGANITRGTADAKKLERSLITSNAKVASGGVANSEVSRDTGGVALSGRETTKVESSLSEAEGLGVHAKLADNEVSARSEEEIRKVMERNKGAIFSIYHRELRKDPTLEGKLTVKMVIEPSGAISSASIVSSELNSKTLESKVLSRIRLINFGEKDVLATTLNYTFDFLPY